MLGCVCFVRIMIWAAFRGTTLWNCLWRQVTKLEFRLTGLFSLSASCPGSRFLLRRNIAPPHKNLYACKAVCMLHILIIEFIWAMVRTSLVGASLGDRFWSQVIFLTENSRDPGSRSLPCPSDKQRHRCARQKHVANAT